MRIVFRVCLIPALLAGIAMAQPSITGLQNNYSYILPGLPNYGIAQGSIFVMYGKNMGPAQIVSQSAYPLMKNLAGVTINVTVGGTTVQAIPYYVSATQVAAILPSATPTGNGKITVTYSGQTSAQADIKVVASAFGLLTLNGAGSGTAAVFNANNGNAYLGPTAAANPDDTIILWGTGLGPVGGDETTAQTQANLSSPLQVYIGGQSAQVSYHGRSQFPGLDQINVLVPAGVNGCSVSVILQTGTYVSNTATIPVTAKGSRVCSDTVTGGFSSSDIQTILAKGTFRAGFIFLDKSSSQTPSFSTGSAATEATTLDLASADFTETTVPQSVTTVDIPATLGFNIQQTSLGSCTAYQIHSQQPTNTPNVPTTPVDPNIKTRALDAGAITMRLPNGSTMALPRDQSLGYGLNGSNTMGSTTPLFIPDSGGQFTFTNTGADVGPFTAQITMPPALNWTNSISTIPRGQSLTVTWDKNTPYSGFVTISGSSFSDTSTQDSTTIILSGFSCTAPYSDGSFTVPSYILLSMAPSQIISFGTFSYSTGSLSLGINGTPVRFTAPNLDFALIEAGSSSSRIVTYQ